MFLAIGKIHWSTNDINKSNTKKETRVQVFNENYIKPTAKQIANLSIDGGLLSVISSNMENPTIDIAKD